MNFGCQGNVISIDRARSTGTLLGVGGLGSVGGIDASLPGRGAAKRPRTCAL
jgi:hypothetical protein